MLSNGGRIRTSATHRTVTFIASSCPKSRYSKTVNRTIAVKAQTTLAVTCVKRLKVTQGQDLSFIGIQKIEDSSLSRPRDISEG